VSEPFVRVELVDGTNTWVTVVPVRRTLPKPSEGVILAAADAAGLFIRSIADSGEVVALHLLEARGRDGV
jgi:hypothetical protein